MGKTNLKKKEKLKVFQSNFSPPQTVYKFSMMLEISIFFFFKLKTEFFFF